MKPYLRTNTFHKKAAHKATPTATIHSCCRASSGVILVAGSHSRHRRMKSRNETSVVLMAKERSFEPGLLFLPLELVIQRGLPRESAGEREGVREGGREGGTEGKRERGRDGGREGGTERGTEGEGGKEGGRDRGKREREREGGRREW